MNTAEFRTQPRAARTGNRPGVRPEGGSSTLDADRIWSPTDVCEYLQIPMSSLYKMTARKAAVPIPHIRIGRALRFKRSDIDRWLALLSVSNLNTLTKMRRMTGKTTHGNDSQAQAP